MSLDISFYRTSPVTVFTRPRQLVQPGSRCGSDPSHHETGGCRVETGGGGSGMSAPIDSWLARIDRPEFSARKRTYLTDFGTPRDFPSCSRSGKSDKCRTWRYSRVVSRTPDVSVNWATSVPCRRTPGRKYSDESEDDRLDSRRHDAVRSYVHGRR